MRVGVILAFAVWLAAAVIAPAFGATANVDARVEIAAALYGASATQAFPSARACFAVISTRFLCREA